MDRKSIKEIARKFPLLIFISIILISIVASIVERVWGYFIAGLLSSLGLTLIVYGIIGVFNRSVMVGDIDEDPREVVGSRAGDYF
jgi:hypothetical protein